MHTSFHKIPFKKSSQFVAKDSKNSLFPGGPVAAAVLIWFEFLNIHEVCLVSHL